MDLPQCCKGACVQSCPDLRVWPYYAELCCAMLCCAVLCCAVLCCATVCYTKLGAQLLCRTSAVLCCAVLCCAVLCCAVLNVL